MAKREREVDDPKIFDGVFMEYMPLTYDMTDEILPDLPSESKAAAKKMLQYVFGSIIFLIVQLVVFYILFTRLTNI